MLKVSGLALGMGAERSLKGIPMGRSFFGRTDVELYTGSKAFTSQIVADPERFGLSADLAAQYQALNDSYAASYRAAVSPGSRSNSIVAGKNDVRAKLRAMASTLAKRINGTPGVTDEMKLQLGLSVPGRSEAVAELGKPDQCTFTLNVDGSLRLTWKCVNRRATGTVYMIWRQIQSIAGERAAGADGEMKFLGICRKRTFTDLTMSAGVSGMLYKIQAVRSTAVGEVAMFPVTFGVRSGQSLPKQMADPTQKLAA